MTDQVGKFKGLLSPDSESKGGKMVDKAIVAKGVVEMVDGPVATMSIRGLDNYLGDRVPQVLEDDANKCVDALYKAYYEDDKPQYKVAIGHLATIIKVSVPLEKVLGQAGEDAAIGIAQMIAEWLILGDQNNVKAFIDEHGPIE